MDNTIFKKLRTLREMYTDDKNLHDIDYSIGGIFSALDLMACDGVGVENDIHYDERTFRIFTNAIDSASVLHHMGPIFGDVPFNEIIDESIDMMGEAIREKMKK